MGKLIAIGAAQAKPQIDTVTMTCTFADTETVTIKVGAASITYTCGAGETVSTVAAGLLALCQASDDPRFRELTWTALAGVITATSAAGLPVTITTSDTAASGASAVANVQAATGPNHWNNAENWSTGAVPTTSDEVYIERKEIALLYGLPTSLTLDRFVMTAGQLGLPERSVGGYPEYRTKRAVFTCTDVVFGREQGSGPSLARVDLASGAAVVGVYGSLTRNDGTAAIDILANHSSAQIAVAAGQVAVAPGGAETTEVATIRVGAQGNVVVGEGVTVATIVSAGNTTVLCDVTNLTVDAGQTTITGVAAITNLIVRSGSLVHKSSGTITDAVVGPGTLDCAQDLRLKTITDLALNKGGALRDPYSVLTITNGLVLGADADVLQAS